MASQPPSPAPSIPIHVRLDLWTTWVALVGLGAAATGVVFACAAHTSALAPLHDPAFATFWGADAPGEAARRYAYWTHGVLGGVMAGWGATVVGVALGPFRRRERWAWWCLLLAFGSWFVLDTGASIAYGAIFNVWLNAGALVFMLIPILATARACLGAGSAQRCGTPQGT